MCFSSPDPQAAVAPAAAPPAPAPLAQAVSPTYNATAEDTSLYGPGGTPSLLRPSTTAVPGGAGSTAPGGAGLGSM